MYRGIEPLECRLLMAAQTNIATVPTLASPWANTAINALGHASQTGNTFTVAGGGAGIGGKTDAFDYCYQPLNGDGAIIARVSSIQNTDPAALAGIMIRQSVVAGAAEVGLFVEPNGSLQFIDRLQSGGDSATQSPAIPLAKPSHARHAATAIFPQWLRLDRKGNLITAEASVDGKHWTVVGTASIAMGAMVDVGMAVTSHSLFSVNTATFDQVSVVMTRAEHGHHPQRVDEPATSDGSEKDSRNHQGHGHPSED